MESTIKVEKSENKKNKNSIIEFISKWGTVITIVFLVALFGALMPTTFLTMSNMTTILRGISIVTVIAIGVTISLTVNGFDLSVGSTATFATSLVMTMFVWYGMSTFTSIGLALLVALVVAAVNSFLTYTKHGRYMYAVGGNLEAARLSGIPVEKYRALAYFLSTLFASMGGILIAARVGSAQINAGAGYLMPAVAAAYIGFSFAGSGKANAIGTLVGALLVGILENGLVMMSVPYYSLDIVKGAVLAIALASTYFRKKN